MSNAAAIAHEAVGDTPAAKPTFAEFYRQCRPWIWQLASGIARRLGMEVDDVDSQLTLLLLQTWDRYDPARSAMTSWCAMKGRWLYWYLRDRMRRKLQPGCLRIVAAIDAETGHMLEFPDPDQAEPGDVAADRIDAEAVRNAMRYLPRRTREILALRSGLDGIGPLSLGEVGERLGVGRERVRQIEEKGLLKLAELLGVPQWNVQGLAKTQRNHRAERAATATATG